MSISAADYKAAWEKAEQEIERLTAELAAERERKKSYMKGEIAEYERAEKAEKRVAKLREALEKARTGIAVLGDTTKHLGLQLGQDRAAEMMQTIDAVLNDVGGDSE
jgi:dsDNA-specific endonuclease/ATPase MutS2